MLKVIKLNKITNIIKLNNSLILKSIFIFVLIIFYACFVLFPLNIILSKNNEINNFDDLITFEQNVNLNLSTEIYKEFLLINKQNKLIENHKNFLKVIDPEITVIMTVYNQAHCLHTCLRSIQNQCINNLEININSNSIFHIFFEFKK